MSAATAVGLQKFAVKFFARSAEGVELRTFVPIFHRWIQEHKVPGILVDVADYGHVANGPGVVLVGHEADFFVDTMEGPLGLLYNRKLPIEGSFAERLRAGVRIALEACATLEAEPEFEGMLKFNGSEALFIANDRLAAPNTEEAFAGLRPDFESVFGALWGKVALERDASDPRRRLTVRVKASTSSDAAALAARLRKS
jgi:hypothetical protein